MLIAGSLLFLTAKAIKFFKRNVRELERLHAEEGDTRFRWLVFPAVALHRLFSRIFGDTDGTWRSLVTWRSFSLTFLLSLIANTSCILLIATSSPPDAPSLELPIIKIFAASYVVFILSYFIGDLISIAATRHILYQIVVNKRNFLRYVVINLFTILAAYVLTISPALLTLIYCIITNSNLNSIIRVGLFGSVIIPFFLFIFATSHLPFPFFIFAFIAILSITIPTMIYVAAMVLWYILCRPYLLDKDWENTSYVYRCLMFLGQVGKILVYASPILYAVYVTIKYRW